MSATVMFTVWLTVDDPAAEAEAYRFFRDIGIRAQDLDPNPSTRYDLLEDGKPVFVDPDAS